MKRNFAVLTLLILVGLCACDTRELSPSTSPTPGVPRALSPAPTSMATLTATPTPRPTVTPTREPTMTPWPTYTASPTRTATPTPTPLPQLPAWLYPTDPHARELFEQVRRARHSFIDRVCPDDYDDPLFYRARDNVFKTADAYLSEYPDTLAAAAVHAMVGDVHATFWHIAAGGLCYPALYSFSQRNEDYDEAIRLYLAHSQDLDISLVEGLKTIGLPIVWSQETDTDGDTKPDMLLGLGLWGGYPEGSIEYLYTLCTSGEDTFVPYQILTQYVNREGIALGHRIKKVEVADVNRDGQNEIVVQNVYIYAGGPGLYANVFQWQENDFVNVLDWEGPDLYYGQLRMRELAESGTTELISSAGKMRPEWALNLSKTFYYQWDGQRYTFQLPLRYSEYYDHAEEDAHYYFFGQRDYAKALAEYETTLARYEAQYGEEYEEYSSKSYYFVPWCHVNIIVCHKALDDEARFQETYAAFREKYPQWVWTLDEQLLKLRAEQDPGLKHAWHDGTAWHIEKVPTDNTKVSDRISLVLDEANRPHISYNDYINSSLQYVWYDGTTWQVKKVPVDALELFANPSLALDSAGRPHISYNDFDLKYTWHDGTTWHVRTVDSTGSVGSHTPLVLDSTDHPHISYYLHRQYLKYVWFDGTAWHTEAVVSAGSGGISDLSLALDQADQPHIGFYGYTHGNLQYAWRDGTTWHVETVPTDGQEGATFALALDKVGRPHISFYDHTHGDLKYAWRDGATWHVETVGSTGDVGSISLVVDEAGHPHIGYYDHTHGDIEYAWHDGATWRVETVASPGIVRSNVVLVLDGTGRPHIGYYSGSSDG